MSETTVVFLIAISWLGGFTFGGATYGVGPFWDGWRDANKHFANVLTLGLLRKHLWP